MDEKEKVTGENDLGILVKNLAGSIKSNLKKNISWFLMAMLFLVGAVAVNYYYQFQLVKTNPQKVVQQETKDLIGAVARLIVLPSEEPTIATVADPGKLSNQPFFAHAQKGDKVLIYANAKKAVLYSPIKNRIIEVAPLNIGTPTTPTFTPTPTF